ncbi:TetR family transcriptional regulator [Mycobacterium tuberculosis]|nr:TetR family transcriptional regulator [Mycobacterium tuberculosis]
MKADLPSLDKAPGAGRPRDPRIDSAILSATAELLVQIGYSNLSLAAVAERAGTTKSALYRRWSSKAELVHEAAFPAAPTALQAAAGDIAADIRMMIAATRDGGLSRRGIGGRGGVAIVAAGIAGPAGVGSGGQRDFRRCG